MPSLTKTLRVFLLPSLVVCFSACSMWDSFTAYFNTYYNAQRQFREAEDELWSTPELRYTGRDMLVTINAAQASKTKFTAVIEKCSKLLQYHPESGLIDDALLMIGKSYYYQADWQRAERKFNELIERYPESDLFLQARLLLASTHYKAGDRAEAARVAGEVLEAAVQEGESSVVADANALLGRMALEDKNYPLATEHYAIAAEEAENAEKRTSALMAIALADSSVGDFENAAEAYRRAANESGSYSGEYKGRIGEVRALALGGSFGTALDRLDRLRDNINFKEYYGEIDLERANVTRDDGELDDAMELYRYVDTAFARTEWSANAVYQLGRIYEDRFGNYDSARTFYTRGRGISPTARITPQIVRRSDYMMRHLTLTREIGKYDSIRTVLLAPPDTTQQAQPDSAEALLSQKDTVAVQRQPPPPPISLDTANVRLAGAMVEIATLFYMTINRPDSARHWYTRLLREFPESRTSPRALYVLAQLYEQDSTASPAVRDSIYRMIIDRFPDSEFADESRRILGMPERIRTGDPAEMRYAEAEQLYMAGQFDEAIAGFTSVAEEFPASPFASKAYYATGQIYEQEKRQVDSAVASYQRLVDKYPGSTQALKVRPMLLEVAAVKKAEQDSIAARELREQQKSAAEQGALQQQGQPGQVPPAVQTPPQAAPDSAAQKPKEKVPEPQPEKRPKEPPQPPKSPNEPQGPPDQ